jgi:hypothetical protein
MTIGQLRDFCGNDIERIQSIGYSAGVFLQGFFFSTETQPSSVNPNAANYRHPDAPVITGSFPRPWQSLSEQERTERSRIRSDTETIPLVPFERGPSVFAKWIAEYCDHQREQAFDQQARVKAKNPDIPETELWGRHLFRSPDMRTSLYATGAEVGVFRINWAAFTNEQLRDGFYSWIRDNRPRDFRAPDGRGKKTLSYRVKLERLAILRLLHRFTLDELQSACPEAWHHYSKAPNRRWRKEASLVPLHFREFLPFLPENELPRSWPPKA